MQNDNISDNNNNILLIFYLFFISNDTVLNVLRVFYTIGILTYKNMLIFPLFSGIASARSLFDPGSVSGCGRLLFTSLDSTVRVPLLPRDLHTI